MERTAERFDYAVLGGGTAGCVVAARLSEDAGRSVCLVEAGPDYGPHSAGGWPADMLSTFSLPDSHDWSDGEATLRIARVLGGCSAHNACFLVRGAPADYDGWGPGWSHAELAPYLDRATEAIGGRPLADEEETPWGNVVRGAAAELGIPIVDAEGDGAVEGLARFPINVAGGARWNAAFAHLDPARGRDNLELVADSTVDRLELDGSSPPKAVVARFDGGELRIRAERFVIAAGAYGSPAILLRSGVGPPDHLRELSIPVRHELPVGDGLQDHAGMAILFEPGDELRRETLEYARRPGALAGGCLFKLRSRHAEEGLWDGHSMPFSGWQRDATDTRTDEPYVSLSSYVMNPRSTGAVRLRSRDPAALPAVDNRFCTDQDGHDLEVILDGLRRVRELASTNAIGAAVSGELGETPAIDDEPAWREFAKVALTSYYHPTSTCGIGRVVDDGARVLGLDNVYVADASIIPTIPRANTNLSVLAVAERVAELLGR